MSKLMNIVRIAAAGLAIRVAANGADAPLEYRVLATSRTSTMEKELNEAAAAGFHFARAMGGKSANGGQETIAVMVKEAASADQVRKYKLLATTRTSTMQNEIQHWAGEGYEYKEQTIFETAFGGKEVVVIMELDPASNQTPSSYRLLATSKTSTMQKELQEAGSQGYVLLGLTVGKTEIGGDEIVAVLRKK